MTGSLAAEVVRLRILVSHLAKILGDHSHYNEVQSKPMTEYSGDCDHVVEEVERMDGFGITPVEVCARLGIDVPKWVSEMKEPVCPPDKAPCFECGAMATVHVMMVEGDEPRDYCEAHDPGLDGRLVSSRIRCDEGFDDAESHPPTAAEAASRPTKEKPEWPDSVRLALYPTGIGLAMRDEDVGPAAVEVAEFVRGSR